MAHMGNRDQSLDDRWREVSTGETALLLVVGLVLVLALAALVVV